VRDLWERLRAAWDNLSLRERALVGAVGVAFGGALFWLVAVQPVLNAADAAESRTQALRQDLEVMTRLRREYDGVAGRLAAVEQRIRQGGDQTTGLRTHLETLAGRSAVAIDSMEERQTPEGERYRETKMEVSLRGVTLTQTIGYLHQIEASDRLLSVKSLRIKNRRTRGDEAQLLDVTFTVSAFEPRAS